MVLSENILREFIYENVVCEKSVRVVYLKFKLILNYTYLQNT